MPNRVTELEAALEAALVRIDRYFAADADKFERDAQLTIEAIEQILTGARADTNNQNESEN